MEKSGPIHDRMPNKCHHPQEREFTVTICLFFVNKRKAVFGSAIGKALQTPAIKKNDSNHMIYI